MEQPPKDSPWSRIGENANNEQAAAVNPYGAPTFEATPPNLIPSADEENRTTITADPYGLTTTHISNDISSASRLRGIVKGATTALALSRGSSVQPDIDDFPVQEDIYSMLLIAPFSLCNSTFVYCVFFLSFQVIVIILIAADLLSDGTDDNWLAIPHGVGILVSVSQVFALFIAVITQQDILTALYLASVGYHPTHVPPTASKEKWIFTNILRFLLGMTILFLCFIFIVQSTNVLDLFKDFAAVTFVGEIDDAAFILAKYGFITDGLRKTAQDLQNVRLEERDDSLSFRGGRAKCHCRFRQLFLLAVFSAMTAYWGTLYSRQKNGEFITPTLHVQFGDEVYDTLHYAFFTGEYVQAPGERIAQRPVYYERGSASNRTSGRFFYCEEEEAWVFGVYNISKSRDRDSGCNWLAKSYRTDKYDLAEVASFGWKIWTGRIQEAEHLRILPSACQDDTDCNYHGQCMPNGQCECDAGWLGKACRFEDTVCPNLVFYLEANPVQNFTILLDENDQPTLSYDRPVFYGTGPSDGRFYVILYTGRRWFITMWDGDDLATAHDVRKSLDVQFFHAFWTQLYRKSTVVFSSPTESIMPVSPGVEWDLVSASKSKGDFGTLGFFRSLQFARLHCEQVDCSIPLVCGLNGVCVNETCVCHNETRGHFCQFPFVAQIDALRESVSGNVSSTTAIGNDGEL